MIDRQSRVLTSLREKHTEIVTQIRVEIDKTDMDNDKLQRLKRLMQSTKIEEHGSVLRFVWNLTNICKKSMFLICSDSEIV